MFYKTACPPLHPAASQPDLFSSSSVIRLKREESLSGEGGTFSASFSAWVHLSLDGVNLMHRSSRATPLASYKSFVAMIARDGKITR